MADDAAEKARKKAFFTKQRQTDEERAAEGDTKAQAELHHINTKLSRPDPEYTDADAVNKAALANVGGPEDAAGLAAGWLAKKGAGMAIRAGAKAISKLGKGGKAAAEGAEKGTKALTTKARKPPGPRASTSESGPAQPAGGRVGPQKALTSGKTEARPMKNVTPKAKSPKADAPKPKAVAKPKAAAKSKPKVEPLKSKPKAAAKGKVTSQGGEGG